jgi:hypothetical protein
MSRLVLVPLACLALAACNKDPQVSLTNATPEEVANAAAAAQTNTPPLRAGQWETRVEMLKIDMPGMPPQMVEMMKKRSATTVSSCMTEEQARKPSAETFAPNRNAKCTFRHFTMGGGKLDATMACKEGEGAMTMTMKGDYAPEKIDYQATIDTNGAQKMTMATRVTAHRIGECTGKS